MGAWVQLDLFLGHYLSITTDMPQGTPGKKTMLASSFGATLEMTREGLIDLIQDGPFAPIHIRKRAAGDEPASAIAAS